MNINLKAIRAAAEAATKGNWRITAQGKHVVSVDSGRICSSPEHMAEWNWDANAKHIATANPATILELLDRLEAAEKDAARYRWLKHDSTAQTRSSKSTSASINPKPKTS